MDKLEITYQQLMDIGFKRYDYEDQVFFKENGYHPFVLSYKLTKGFSMEISSDRDIATLYKAEKKPFSENYKSYMILNSVKEIQYVFAAFGHTEKAIKINPSNLQVPNG